MGCYLDLNYLNYDAGLLPVHQLHQEKSKIKFKWKKQGSMSGAVVGTIHFIMRDIKKIMCICDGHLLDCLFSLQWLILRGPSASGSIPEDPLFWYIIALNFIKVQLGDFLCKINCYVNLME